MSKRLHLVSRLRAAGWHLLISLMVAALAAALVFRMWYPGEYRLFSGGRNLFFLLTSVDVTLGPLLTLVVFDVRKGWPHLRRDLAVIGLLQLAALTYGLRTVYLARPVAMVFEVDRFRVITVADVYAPELPRAQPEYRHLPMTGPWLLGTRAPKDAKEKADALFMGVGGVDIGQRPTFWQAYADSMQDAARRSRPIEVLLKHYAARGGDLRTQLANMHADLATAGFTPLVARGDWVVVLDARGAILGYLPVDGFF